MARDGGASTENLRLRCRAHNQYAAECVFGAEFMNRKRQEARWAAAEARTAALKQANERAEEQAKERAKEQAKKRAEEVIPWLRTLGIRADDARRAAERCEAIPDASLEERVRVALRSFGPRTASRGRVAHASADGGP